MPIIDGVDVASRSRVYDPNASLESKQAFWKAVGLTKAGQKLFNEFEINEDETGALIIQIAKDLNPGVRFLTADMAAGATEVIVYRPLKYGLKRKPAVAPVTEAPVEVPVDKNNKKLGASQLAWREHAEWARTATSAQIRKRKEVDPSFRAFVVNSLKIEMDQPVDAAPSFAIPAEHTATGEDMRSELGAFATAYKRSSASQLRPIGGFHKLSFPDAKGNVIERVYSPSEWETVITAAARAGLL